MHMPIFFLLLAVGTFLYFPRLAKALVGLGLLGCLAVAGIVGFQIVEHSRAAERAQHPTDPADIQVLADYAFLTHRLDAGRDGDTEPSQEELHCAVYGQERPMTERTRVACRLAVLQIQAHPMPTGLPAVSPPPASPPAPRR